MEHQIKNRISYIDVFRGLLMLLVVLGHSIGATDDPVNRVILSFHMPAFFVLSGMCMRPKSDFTVCEVLKRKARSLAWPYLTLSLMSVSLYWLFLAGTAQDKGVSPCQSLLGIFWNDRQYGVLVTPGFWFVYDLLWINLIYVLTKSIDKVKLLVASTALFLLLYLSKADFYFSQEATRISAGFMFFMLGDIFVAKGLETRLERICGGGKIGISTFLFCFITTICVSQINTPVGMMGNGYGNIMLFFISSCCGTLAFYVLARMIAKQNFLEFIGRNSLLFLQIHFFFLMTTHVLWHKVVPTADNYTFPLYLFHFMVAVLGCSCYSWIMKRYFPWLLRIRTQVHGNN